MSEEFAASFSSVMQVCLRRRPTLTGASANDRSPPAFDRLPPMEWSTVRDPKGTFDDAAPTGSSCPIPALDRPCPERLSRVGHSRIGAVVAASAPTQRDDRYMRDWFTEFNAITSDLPF
jgi:hypothetical protein